MEKVYTVHNQEKAFTRPVSLKVALRIMKTQPREFGETFYIYKNDEMIIHLPFYAISNCDYERVVKKVGRRKIKEYNFEIYTINPRTKEGGWDIYKVSVIAETKEQAKKMLKKTDWFDEIILFNYECEIKDNIDLLDEVTNKVIKVRRGDIFIYDNYNPKPYQYLERIVL